MLVINAIEATGKNGLFRPSTARAAIREALENNLKSPGDSVKIAQVVGADGTLTPVRTVQIQVAQVRPDGWLLASRRDGDVLTVWRLE